MSQLQQHPIKTHGLSLVKNSWIENMVVESLATDPVLTTEGRLWFNSTDNVFKGSFKTVDDTFTQLVFASADDLQKFIDILKSSEGTDNIGFAGYNTESLMLSAGPLTDTIKVLADRITELDIQGGDGIHIVDEGIDVLATAKKINFVGNDILAVKSTDGEVTVYVPAPSFAPMYNSIDATVPNVATTNRKISLPTNDEFFIGNWTAGVSQNSLLATLLTYTTPAQVGFNDKTTTISATVYGADDTTPLATTQISNIGDNSTKNENGIIITISNWDTDYFRFKADVKVEFNLTTILPAGGRFKIKIEHNNSTLGIFEKIQGPLFFDINDILPTIESISIVEKTPTIKKLSGVDYYTTNSAFDIAVNKISNINRLTWPNDNNVVKVMSNALYGIADHFLAAATTDIIDWTNVWDAANLNALNAKTITRSNFRFIGTNATVSCNWIDWSNGSELASTNAAILIDTYGVSSTNQDELFTDENKRLKVDLATNWDSNELLTSSDLMVHNGTLRRQEGNWTTYKPTNIANYATVNTDTQVYYREFTDTGIAHSNGILNIIGISEADLTSGNVKIEISLNKTDWFNCNNDYTSGALSNGSGCRINIDTRPLPNLEFTLGTGGSTDASTGTVGFGLFVRISMPASSTCKISSFKIINW